MRIARRFSSFTSFITTHAKNQNDGFTGRGKLNFFHKLAARGKWENTLPEAHIYRPGRTGTICSIVNRKFIAHTDVHMYAQVRMSFVYFSPVDATLRPRDLRTRRTFACSNYLSLACEVRNVSPNFNHEFSFKEAFKKAGTTRPQFPHVSRQ